MNRLKITSLQAPNMDFVGRALAEYVAETLNIETEFIDDLHWLERERLLDSGEIDIAWICGLPYVHKLDHLQLPIELLAAPVMKHQRYKGRPVYYSDVVVRSDSPYQTFADLRGASWSYNEPRSQSGYNITRYHLAKLSETSGYFGQVVEAGAHQTSLQMVVAGEVEASAIDSTVLEMELQNSPWIIDHIRIIGKLGPSPIPPWVVSTRLPQSLREMLRQTIITMHITPQGRTILDQAMTDQFVNVSDKNYDLIRHMAKTAEPVCL